MVGIVHHHGHFVGAGKAYTLLRQVMPSASLLISERSGRVALLHGDNDATELAPHGRWPTATPDGRHVALSTVVSEGESGRAVIVAVNPAGERVSLLHEGPPGVLALIAPNVPHYALWSPAGTMLSYVAATEQGLALFVSSLDGTLKSHRVVVGAPLFHSWSPDGRWIAVHAGTELGLFDVEQLELTSLHHNAAGFRTPVFTADGSALVYAAPVAGTATLLRQDLGGSAREVGRFDGGLAFASVGASELLVAVTRQADASYFDDLLSIRLDTGERRRVARGPFAAFWASPRGGRVVLLVPSQTGDGRHSLQARSPEGAFLGATESFFLSDDFRVATAFFDQYTLSHPLWSPGGEEILVAGRLLLDSVSSSFGDSGGDSVMTWRATRGEPLHREGWGTFGSFVGNPA